MAAMKTAQHECCSEWWEKWTEERNRVVVASICIHNSGGAYIVIVILWVSVGFEFILLQNFIHTHTHTQPPRKRKRVRGHNQTNGTLPLAVSRRFIPTACGIVFICENYIHFDDTYLPVSSSTSFAVTFATYTHTTFWKTAVARSIWIF